MLPLFLITDDFHNTITGKQACFITNDDEVVSDLTERQAGLLAETRVQNAQLAV